MSSLRIMHVVGARPNFIKVASVIDGLNDQSNVSQILVHTGQHYDHELSRVFFEDLGLPEPDYDLGVGSGTHVWQTAHIMLALENVLEERRPDIVVVVGDVNSTVAAALVAAKRGIVVAHVEAGLRSFDWSMPEEINRVVTDRLSNLLFTTEESANKNLRHEGVSAQSIHFVGNTMIDTLYRHLDKARALRVYERFNARCGDYALATLHRPSNVDTRQKLVAIIEALAMIAKAMPVVFPVHPRTRSRLNEFGLLSSLGDTILIPPLGYLEFINLLSNAKVVLTDSGGIQEETTALRVRCLTLRPNTERPVTVLRGTNELVELRTDAIVEAALREHSATDPVMPELWDGQAGQRIAKVLQQF